MEYLSWNKKTENDLSPDAIDALYEEGYVFTRVDKGVMVQTRSVRIDLSSFEPSSENRRILKKVADVKLETAALPFAAYDWNIGKLAKDFYDKKFGSGVMSAQKIKEMLSNGEKSNFNKLFIYSEKGRPAGYTICYEDGRILHYSYPFYDLACPKDMGLGMMLLAILYAKDRGLRYIYLGSLQRPGDVYKLQFKGLQWFDGQSWQTDLEKAKLILSTK